MLARSLREPTLPAHVHRYVIDEREGKGEITPAERPEHLMVMIKSGGLRHLTGGRV